MKLHRNFNQHCLQMCDKYSKTIIKTSEQDKVYIIKYITKNFNEFVLMFAMHTSLLHFNLRFLRYRTKSF